MAQAAFVAVSRDARVGFRQAHQPPAEALPRRNTPVKQAALTGRTPAYSSAPPVRVSKAWFPSLSQGRPVSRSLRQAQRPTTAHPSCGACRSAPPDLQRKRRHTGWF
jgi:hypothetical protein